MGFTDKGTKPCPVPIFLLLSLEPSAEFPEADVGEKFGGFCLSFLLVFIRHFFLKDPCCSMVLWQESKRVFTACFPCGGRGILQNHCSVSNF